MQILLYPLDILPSLSVAEIDCDFKGHTMTLLNNSQNQSEKMKIG